MGQHAQPVTGQPAKDKIEKLINEIKVAQLVTCTGDHDMHARPMQAETFSDTGEFWFWTELNSRKVADIREQSHVLLSYAHPGKQDYVSLSGKAEIVTDRARIDQLWSKSAETWFPKGPSDPNVALIRIQANEAQYVDATGNPIVYAYGFIKAKLTGDPPEELGEMGKASYRTAS